MKLVQASKLLVLAGVCDAFAPTKFGAPRSTARSLSIDPSILEHLPNQVQSLQDAFSSMSLSDGFPNTWDAMRSASDSSAAIDLAGNVAAPAADAATEAAADGNGWFGFLVTPIEFLLTFFHSALSSAGLSKNAWGVSIIAITLVIKLLTFPLTQTQLESTNKMQVSVAICFVLYSSFGTFAHPKQLLSRPCNP
jgi:YidC/Oxa1 family membrane protein insertase